MYFSSRYTVFKAELKLLSFKQDLIYVSQLFLDWEFF